MTAKDIRQHMRTLIASLLLPFRRDRVFAMYLGNPQHTYEEDPKCPLSWRGSGCYDIEYFKWDYILIRICARTEAEAESLFEAWREAQYDKLRAQYAEQYKGTWRESRAVEYASEGSYRDCVVLGFLPDDEGGKPLGHGEFEEVQTVEGQWSRDDDDTDLEEALDAFGVAKRLRPSYAK